jgi:hypothetical protein
MPLPTGYIDGCELWLTPSPAALHRRQRRRRRSGARHHRTRNRGGNGAAPFHARRITRYVEMCCPVRGPRRTRPRLAADPVGTRGWPRPRTSRAGAAPVVLAGAAAVPHVPLRRVTGGGGNGGADVGCRASLPPRSADRAPRRTTAPGPRTRFANAFSAPCARRSPPLCLAPRRRTAAPGRGAVRATTGGPRIRRASARLAARHPRRWERRQWHIVQTMSDFLVLKLIGTEGRPTGRR